MEINIFIDLSMQIGLTKYDLGFLKNKKKKIDSQFRYICECGKKYDNFPALYLHFQRKHDIRISMKLHQSNVTLDQKGLVTHITYKLDQKVENQHFSEEIYENIEIREEIQNMLDMFKLNLETEGFQGNDDLVFDVLNKLKKYLVTHLKTCKDNIINSIPYYFNGFIIGSICRQIELENYKFTCDLLLKFGQWMKQNKKTDLIVQYVGFKCREEDLPKQYEQ